MTPISIITKGIIKFEYYTSPFKDTSEKVWYPRSEVTHLMDDMELKTLHIEVTANEQHSNIAYFRSGMYWGFVYLKEGRLQYGNYESNPSDIKGKYHTILAAAEALFTKILDSHNRLVNDLH